MNDLTPYSLSDEAIESAQERLFKRFLALGIVSHPVPYPAHKTVEEGKLLRGKMAGTFTKNLLLKDKKDRYFLIAVHEDRVLNLKTLHLRIGAKGQLSFASTERMVELLEVVSGALTPLALINDTANRVTMVVDSSLLEADRVNFHPLIHTESVGLKPGELLAFIRSCEREPLLIDFDTAAS